MFGSTGYVAAMSDQPSECGSKRATPRDDETVRVREQTANDIGSKDAFGRDASLSPSRKGERA